MGSTDGSHQSCQGWGWGQQFWIKTKAESNRSELRGGAGKSQATEELVPRASRVRQSYGRVSHEHDREGFDGGDARSWCAAPSLCIADLTLIGSGRLTVEPTGLCRCVTA